MDRFYSQGFKSYTSLYPRCGGDGDAATPASGHRVGVDASPSYIRHPPVPSRIAANYDARALREDLWFVMVLREPVARLISQFSMLKIENQPGGSPFDAWAREQVASARSREGRSRVVLPRCAPSRRKKVALNVLLARSHQAARVSSSRGSICRGVARRSAGARVGVANWGRGRARGGGGGGGGGGGLGPSAAHAATRRRR